MESGICWVRNVLNELQLNCSHLKMFLPRDMRWSMIVVRLHTWTSPSGSTSGGGLSTTSSISSFPVFSSLPWLCSASLFPLTLEKNSLLVSRNRKYLKLWRRKANSQNHQSLPRLHVFSPWHLNRRNVHFSEYWSGNSSDSVSALSVKSQFYIS